MVALLSEEPPREYGDDLAAALRTARRGQDGYAGRWRQEVRRLSAQVDGGGSGFDPGSGSGKSPGSGVARGTSTGPDSGADPRGSRSDDAVVGLVAALAFPERVARARGEGAFLMVSGTGAELGTPRGCAARPGSPSPSRTGPPTRPRRAYGWRR